MSCVVTKCAKHLGVDERTVFSQAALSVGFQSDIESLFHDFGEKRRIPSFVAEYCEQMLAREKPRKRTSNLKRDPNVVWLLD